MPDDLREIRNAVILWLLIAAGWAVSANAGWVSFAPTGAEIGTGILRDVWSHADEQGRKNGYEPDLVTRSHEVTHQVNSRIRQSFGGAHVNCFYVGYNKAFVLNEPRVRLSVVAQYVPQQLRNENYQLYFVEQARYWDDSPLYILDEWSAYINGSTAAVELRVDNHGSHDRVKWFSAYADALVQAIREHDPGYAQLNELLEFISYQRKRIDNLFNGSPVAEQWCSSGTCQSGFCPTGNCANGMCVPRIYSQPQRTTVSPVYKPAPSQSVPQPAPRPTIDPNANCEKQAPDIIALRAEIASLKTQISQYKECNCDGCCDKVKAELNAKIETLAQSQVSINQTIQQIQQQQPETPNYEKIAAEVAKHMPPINMRVTPEGQYQQVKLGSYVTLPLDKK